MRPAGAGLEQCFASHFSASRSLCFLVSQMHWCARRPGAAVNRDPALFTKTHFGNETRMPFRPRGRINLNCSSAARQSRCAGLGSRLGRHCGSALAVSPPRLSRPSGSARTRMTSADEFECVDVSIGAHRGPGLPGPVELAVSRAHMAAIFVFFHDHENFQRHAKK